MKTPSSCDDEPLPPQAQAALRQALIRRGELVPLTPEEVAWFDTGGLSVVEEPPAAESFVEEWRARRRASQTPPAAG